VAEISAELSRTDPVSLITMKLLKLKLLPLLGWFAASPLHAQAATPAPEGKGRAMEH